MVCILLSIINDLPCGRLKEKIVEQIAPPQRSAFTTDLFNHSTTYLTVFLYSILCRVMNRIARRKGQFYELKKGGF